jgi:hypothetical protein
MVTTTTINPIMYRPKNGNPYYKASEDSTKKYYFISGDRKSRESARKEAGKERSYSLAKYMA